jgi:hypothetical protein
MKPERKLAILAQAATIQGAPVGWRGLTHHEAATALSGLLERRDWWEGQRLKIRYHLTQEGRQYLEVMQPSTAAASTQR